MFQHAPRGLAGPPTKAPTSSSKSRRRHGPCTEPFFCPQDERRRGRKGIERGEWPCEYIRIFIFWWIERGRMYPRGRFGPHFILREGPTHVIGGVGLELPVRADDGSPRDHHAGGPAVVADGEVQPVGLQGVLLPPVDEEKKTRVGGGLVVGGWLGGLGQ